MTELAWFLFGLGVGAYLMFQKVVYDLNKATGEQELASEPE